jgi:hypothetical protein
MWVHEVIMSSKNCYEFNKKSTSFISVKLTPFCAFARSLFGPHIPLHASTNGINRLQVTPPYTLDGSKVDIREVIALPARPFPFFLARS